MFYESFANGLTFIKSSLWKHKEARNAGWIIGGKMVQICLSFVVGILTTRYLGPGQYGIINYVAAYIAFFAALCTLGINSVIIKEFTENPQEQGVAIGTTLGLRAVSSFLSALMVVTIVISMYKNEQAITAVVILSSISLLFNIFDTFNFWFQLRYQSKITTIATFTAYLATSCYKIILLITHKSIAWFAFATSVEWIVFSVVLFSFYKHYQGPALRFSFAKAKILLSQSYHYILSGMMIAIYGQTDKLMLKQMLDAEAVGYYSLAISINNLWVFMLVAVIDSMAPSIISSFYKDKKQYEQKNRQLYAIIIYSSVVVAIGIMLFGRYFIKILYGEAFLETANPLKIICWYTAFSYLGCARDIWIVCEGQQRYLKYMAACCAIANILLNLVLIPIWGVSGAAMASLLTQIMTVTLIPCFFKSMRPNVKLMLEALCLRGIKYENVSICKSK